MRQILNPNHVIARSYGVILPAGQPWLNAAYGWEQIVTSASGSLRIESEGREWRISPGQAILIPAGCSHQISLAETCDIRAVFVKADQIGSFRLVMLSPLLRELIYHASFSGSLSSLNPDDTALLTLVLSQLKIAPAIPLAPTWPINPQLLEIARRLASNPLEGLAIGEVARNEPASRRTLERRFRSEMGVGLAEWRREHILVCAGHSLLTGKQVSQVAFEAGYCTTSAFIHAFKSKFGASPRKFCDEYRV